MKNIDHSVQRLENIMAAAKESNPHSAELINAYKPLILARTRLVYMLELKKDKTFFLNKDLFLQGHPLLRQNAFFQQDDPFESIAIFLLPALKEGFPNQLDIWEKLSKLIETKAINLYDYFRLFPSEGEDMISQWSQKLGADQQLISFMLLAVARVILEKRARLWADLIKDMEWEKGYCPVCGSFPDISKHKDGTGQRWLHCPLCSHEWRFRRVVCPSCENDAQKTMSYFHVEDKEKESCFSCEKCKHYLITVTKVSDTADFDPDIAALSLAHLDVIMQGKGYQPMTECEWNRHS